MYSIQKDKKVKNKIDKGFKPSNKRSKPNKPNKPNNGKGSKRATRLKKRKVKRKQIKKKRQLITSYDRFIHDKFLASILRPQIFSLCGPTAIAEVLDILYDQKIHPREVMELCPYDRTTIVEEQVFGNDKFRETLKQFHVETTLLNFRHRFDWEWLKKQLKEGYPIVFHRDKHYCLLVGVIEEPLLLNSGFVIKTDRYNKGKWFVIADHRVRLKTDHQSGMLEMIQFEELVKEIRGQKNLSLIICKPGERSSPSTPSFQAFGLNNDSG